MKQSIRQSLRLTKRKSRRVEVPSQPLSSPPTQKKHISLRISQSLRNISTAFVSDSEIPQPKNILLREARHQTICFFPAGSKQEVVALETDVHCKIAKSTGGSFTTFKRAGNTNATVKIGDGRIVIEMGDERHQYEINHVDNINLSSAKAKEVSMTFRGDAQIFFLKCSSAAVAKSLVREIYVEIRRVCFALNRVVENILPEEFRNTQKAEAFNQLPLDERVQAELVLRELVDLNLFSRGPADMAFVESAELLGALLKACLTNDEAHYWLTQASSAKKKLENAMAPNFENDKRHILQQIRNPSEIKEQTEMKTMSVPKNADSLIQRIQVGLKHSAKALRMKEL